MKETIQSRQEVALKELSLMAETLYSQGILSEAVFKGIQERLNKIEKDPLALLIQYADTSAEVETRDGRKFKIRITSNLL